MSASIHRTVLVALLTLAGSAGAVEPKEWLANHAIRLRSLDPSDTNYDDLEPLRRLIGDARVVMLGEQTHGDGAAFLGKARLIKFLHQQMGFDVLCFESGIYDCERAWQAVKAMKPEDDPATVMWQGVFGIWTQSRQCWPTFEYVAEKANSPKPLELCGYDCQLTGGGQHLMADIDALAAAVDPPALDAARRSALAAYVGALVSNTAPSGAVRTDGEAAIAVLRDALSGERFAGVRTPRELAWWRQVLESIQGFASMMTNAKRTDLPLPDRFNARDEQGGRNLLWLARERYPGRKIIVWAASMHCVRHPERITTQTPGLSYGGVRTAGHVAALELEDDLVVLAFTTGPGIAGSVFGAPYPVPPPPAGSLEALCAEAGLGPCIVPLRGAAAGSFGAGEFVARPLGNVSMKARWQEVVDGFVYTPNMTPSTPRPSKEDLAAHGDVLAALDRRAAAWRAACAANGPWADKGGFEIEWDEWRRVMAPDDRTLATTRSRVVEWAETNRGDPCIGWRAHALLGHLAAEERDIGAAFTHFDVAMTAYPAKVHPDPAKQSSYQHLVNARSMVMWNASCFEDAMAWAMQVVATDPKMRAFHAHPWLEKLGADAENRNALRTAVAAAFAARARHMPADADAISATAKAVDGQFVRE